MQDSKELYQKIDPIGRASTRGKTQLFPIATFCHWQTTHNTSPTMAVPAGIASQEGYHRQPQTCNRGYQG